MKFLNRCNGYQFGLPRFNAVEQAAFDAVIKGCRAEFKEIVSGRPASERFGFDRSKGYRFEGNDYCFDYRFDGDLWVEQRISAACTEDEFLSNPRAWVLDALRDCAASDYYYLYEKDYGEF